MKKSLKVTEDKNFISQKTDDGSIVYQESLLEYNQFIFPDFKNFLEQK